MNKILTTLIMSTVLLTGCSNNNGVIVIKNCPLYSNDKKVCDIDLYFFDESKDVPYVELGLGIYELSDHYYDLQAIDATHGRIYGSIDTICTIDFETTEISYNNFDILATGDSITCDDDIYDIAHYSMVNHKKIMEESKFVKGNKYSFKLEDFGLHFKEYNDNIYAPIDLVSLLCFESLSYYYENNAIYCLPVVNEELKQKVSFNHTFTNTYYEHCFDIFMLTQELMSGLKGTTRKNLSDGKNHTFFEKGVVNTLLPYKDKIVNSKTIEDFDKGMMEMMAKELNSGGHDNVDSTSFNSKQEYIYPSEYDVVDYRGVDVKKERKTSIDKDDFSKCVFAYDTDQDGKKDIGYVTFDKFLGKTVKYDDGNIFYGMNEILLGENGANEILNPNSKTYDSSKYDIKDVVIDLTANEGGLVIAEQALSAWLCGGTHQVCNKCPNTGSYNKISYIYDINNDGIYNEQDYLPNTVNIYILTSNASYSCGGLLPFECYTYNKNVNPKNKIKFMGERPAGGSCLIVGPNYLATGFGYYQSRCYIATDYNDINVTPEEEIPIDEGLELTLSQMVDRTGPNGINNLIVSKRKLI